MVTCSMCDRTRIHARGLCKVHYEQARQKGTRDKYPPGKAGRKVDPNAINQRVLALLQFGEPMTGPGLARVLGGNETAVMRALYRLKDKGLVEGSAPGTWTALDVPGRETNHVFKLPPQTTAWRTRAMCNPNNTPDVDPMWQWNAPYQEHMLALCQPCKVKAECLEEQAALKCDGVWGGQVFHMARYNETRSE